MVNPCSRIAFGGPQQSGYNRTLKKEPKNKAGNEKKVIGCATNGLSVVANTVAFVNGNWNTFGLDQENIEKYSDVLTKVATGLQGLVLGIDAWEKKTAIPFVGFASEIPIALFSSDFNLWLFRGISQGLGQFQAVMDRLEIQKDGKYLVDCENKPIFVSDLYNVLDWNDIFKITLKECKRVAGEITSDPKSINKLSHGLFLASILQTFGGGLGLAGATSVGALIRDLAGVGVDLALMTDKKEDMSNRKYSENYTDEISESGEFSTKINGKGSLLKMAGFVWVAAAVVDYAKRVPGFEEQVSNLTNLSLISDRGASLIYTLANIKIQGQEEYEVPEARVNLIEKAATLYKQAI